MTVFTRKYWDWTKDTADFYHATIFSNSTSDGLGTWGDPNNDFQISTGGFKDIRVAYPVPHHIRRNYTNQPFLNGVFDLPRGETEERSLMLNTTFTQKVVDSLVNSFTGDYINFQGTVQVLSGPHPGPHRILGGEMSGKCPYGLAPPACYAGPKWSPNDPMFYLHHAMVDPCACPSSARMDGFGFRLVGHNRKEIFFLAMPFVWPSSCSRERPWSMMQKCRLFRLTLSFSKPGRLAGHFKQIPIYNVF